MAVTSAPAASLVFLSRTAATTTTADLSSMRRNCCASSLARRAGRGGHVLFQRKNQTTSSGGRRRLAHENPTKVNAAASHRSTEVDEGSLDFYDEIIARNDALVDVMLEKIRRRQSSSNSSRSKEGTKNKETKVYLVGCGPGDPGLLTLKAYHLIVTADVILYDRLVSPEILEYAASANDKNNNNNNNNYNVSDSNNDNNEGKGLMLFVGKRSGFHTRTQDEIHDLILEFANAGATVVRLKGGDPLVFGRGGEECEFLREKGFEVHVIPGITAASGVGSSVGVPLTHRGVATSARLLTGHLMKKEKKVDAEENVALSSSSSSESLSKSKVEKVAAEEEGAVDFAVTAADADTTLIIYMGLGTLPKTKKKLLQDGVLGKRTPCLAVENGTTLKERRVFSTLEYIDEAVVDAQLQSPTLLFIGAAVRLSPYFPEALTKDNLTSSSSSLSSSSMKWELQVGQDEDENRMRHTPELGGRCRIVSDINDCASRNWFSKNFINDKLFSSSFSSENEIRSSSRYTRVHL